MGQGVYIRTEDIRNKIKNSLLGRKPSPNAFTKEAIEKRIESRHINHPSKPKKEKKVKTKLGNCSFENCEKLGAYRSTKLCYMHHARKKRHGNPSILLVSHYNTNICSVEHCKKLRHSNGFCSTHYAQLRRKGMINNKGYCKAENCNRYSMAKGYCEKHHYRIWKHNTISEDVLGIIYQDGKPIFSDKTKNKMKNSQLRRFENKENHPRWEGGKSFEPYPIFFDKKLKELIRKRDQYRCQECFHHQDELFNKKGKKYSLNIHHINYNKEDCAPKNLISLCNSCHIKTNWNRNNWQNYFEDKVKNNGGIQNGK